jgi:menaquinol-cytochrome c reductase iron-sulfur subunit
MSFPNAIQGSTLSSTSAEQIPVSADAESVGRRGFLKRISGLGALLSAGLVSFPVLRAIFSPTSRRPTADSWVKVADDTALLDIGVPIRVNFVQTVEDAWVETRALNGVWLYTDDGDKFKAYNGRCTHLGCSYNYDHEKKTFLCPCHHGQFDPKTGAVLAGPPPRPLDELEVQVRDASVFVKYKDFRLGIPERIEA